MINAFDLSWLSFIFSIIAFIKVKSDISRPHHSIIWKISTCLIHDFIHISLKSLKRLRSPLEFEVKFSVNVSVFVMTDPPTGCGLLKGVSCRFNKQDKYYKCTSDTVDQWRSFTLTPPVITWPMLRDETWTTSFADEDPEMWLKTQKKLESETRLI